MGLGSIVMVGMAGTLSDRFGRRPVLFLAIAAFLFVTVPNLLVEYSHSIRSGWRIFFITCTALCGLMGGMSMVLLSLFAYVADCAPEESRSTAFTIVEAAIGTGGLIGDLAGGYCMDLLGPRAVFWALIVILIVLLFYCALMPESLPSEVRSQSIDWRMLNSFYSLSCFFDSRLLRPRRHIIWMAAAFLLAYFTVQGLDGVSTPYLSAAPLSFSDSRIGIVNCIGLAGRMTAGLLFAPWFERNFPGENEELWLVRITLFFYGAFVALIGFGVGLPDLSSYSYVSGFCSALAFGYMRGLFSKSADADMQGRMLGGITFIVAASQVGDPFYDDKKHMNMHVYIISIAFLNLCMISSPFLFFFFTNSINCTTHSPLSLPILFSLPIHKHTHTHTHTHTYLHTHKYTHTHTHFVILAFSSVWHTNFESFPESFPSTL